MTTYDLRTCWPFFDGQDELVLDAVSNCLARPSTLTGQLDAPHFQRVDAIAEAARCEPSHRVSITSSGQSALRVALATICAEGEPIAVEEWTHPGILRAVLDLGAAPFAIGIDRHGMIPEALVAAAEAGIRRVLVQSRIHNPTGAPIGAGRRRALAQVIAGHDMVAIEEDALGFLQTPDKTGLTHLIPDNCIRTIGFAKWISPSLGGGLIEYSGRFAGRVTERIQSSGAHAPGLSIAALAELAAGGHFATFAEAKREEGIARQSIALRTLRIAEDGTRSPSWLVWLPLGDLPFERLSTLRARGIEVSGASLFRLPGEHAPHARISLGGERSLDRLEAALAELANLLEREAVCARAPSPQCDPHSIGIGVPGVVTMQPLAQA